MEAEAAAAAARDRAQQAAAAEAEADASEHQKLRNKANKAREKEEAAMEHAMEKAHEAGLEPEGFGSSAG